MYARQVSVPAGATIGVFSQLAASTQGRWDVYVYSNTSIALAEDAAGTNVAAVLGTGIFKISVRNEEVFVKNTTGTDQTFNVVAVQQ